MWLGNADSPAGLPYRRSWNLPDPELDHTRTNNSERAVCKFFEQCLRPDDVVASFWRCNSPRFCPQCVEFGGCRCSDSQAEFECHSHNPVAAGGLSGGAGSLWSVESE